MEVSPKTIAKLNSKFHNKKNSAKQSKKEFTLTIDWLHKQYAEQGGICLYSGVLFNEELDNLTFERLDADKGYTPENTILVAEYFNQMKGQLDAFMRNSKSFTKDGLSIAMKPYGFVREDSLQPEPRPFGAYDIVNGASRITVYSLDKVLNYFQDKPIYLEGLSKGEISIIGINEDCKKNISDFFFETSIVTGSDYYILTGAVKGTSSVRKDENGKILRFKITDKHYPLDASFELVLGNVVKDFGGFPYPASYPNSHYVDIQFEHRTGETEQLIKLKHKYKILDALCS